MTPEFVGPYVIDKKVGAGGMGTVYRARHKDTDKEVAVKVLPASLARESGFVGRFEREIEAMKKVHNPNIVEFYDNGKTEDGTYYLAMEYVPGETLTRLLGKRRKLPWREVVGITTQICSALKAAHNAGVVHRDLKPSNLMIREDGEVKLTDFGVAHVFASTRLTKTGGVVGTAEYMSPEQAAGKRTTKRSDLYSLGAVMYVMITGRPPYTGQTAHDITHKHLYGQFDLPSRYTPDIPKPLEDIILRLMEKDPEERFPDAFVLQKALEVIRKRADLAADTDVTQVLNSDVPEGSTAEGVAPGAPGSATMMRDLMRVEIEQQNVETKLGKFFNNIFVLLGLLGLVIAGGFFFVRPDGGSASGRFEAGVKLMEAEPGNGWLRARSEFFEPLLDEDKDKWSDKVAPYMAKIERYSSAREFARGRKPFKQPRDEPTRQLSLAVQEAEAGKTDEARQRITTLLNLLSDDDQYEYLISVAERLLAELEQTENEGMSVEFVEEQIARAEQLVSSGEKDAARQIYGSLVRLYGKTKDEDIAKLIDQCKDKLSNAP